MVGLLLGNVTGQKPVVHSIPSLVPLKMLKGICSFLFKTMQHNSQIHLAWDASLAQVVVYPSTVFQLVKDLQLVTNYLRVL